MTETKKIAYITLSVIAFALFLLGAIFIRFIINFPVLTSETEVETDFAKLSTLSLDPLITFVPEELRGGEKESPTVVETDIVYGSSDADIEMVLFSDLVSAEAKSVIPLTRSIVDNNSNVRLVWKDYPVPSIFGDSLIAAVGARCAETEDTDYFWQMNSKILSTSDSITYDMLKDFTNEIGIGSTDYNNCVDNEDTLATVKKNYIEAKLLGLSIPPGLYINGERYQGNFIYSDLSEYINKIE